MWLTLAIRNIWRNAQRTLLTAATVLLGTALLTAALAWIHGMFTGMYELGATEAGHVRVAHPEYVLREQLLPLHANVPQVEQLARELEAEPAVVGAHPRITVGATLTVGEELGDVFGLVVGASDELYERLGTASHLAVGTWLQDPEDAVLGVVLANQLGASVGDELILLGQTQYGSLSPVRAQVSGIAAAGHALVDQQVFLPMDRVRWMADMPHEANELLIYGTSRDHAPRLAQRLARHPELEDMEVQAWNRRDPWVEIVAVSGVVQWILSLVVVFITALAVLNTMTMSVLERTAEIGVMRALGLSRLGAVGLFLLEAAAIGGLGGLAGVAIGSGVARILEVHGIELGEQVVQDAGVPMTGRIHAELTWEVVLLSFALGLAMAFVGAALPALRAASIEPVAAMRARR